MCEYFTEEEGIQTIMELDRLRERKKKLEKEIEDCKEKELFEVAKSSTLRTRESLLRRIPIGWMDSVFCSRRDVLLTFITSTLSVYDLKEAELCARKEVVTKKASEYQYVAVLCEAVLPTAAGSVLVLRDPFRRVNTQPLTHVGIETAQSWIGHILIVKIKILPEQYRLKEVEVCGIKHLRYTRNGKIEQDGRVTKIKSCFEEEWEHAKSFGLEECRKEVKRIGMRAKKKGWCFYHNPGAEHFCNYLVNPQKGYYCQMITKSDIIEVVWEDNARFTDSDYILINEIIGKNLSEHNKILDCDEAKYNTLISSEDCMCLLPEMEDA